MKLRADPWEMNLMKPMNYYEFINLEKLLVNASGVGISRISLNRTVHVFSTCFGSLCYHRREVRTSYKPCQDCRWSNVCNLKQNRYIMRSFVFLYFLVSLLVHLFLCCIFHAGLHSEEQTLMGSHLAALQKPQAMAHLTPCCLHIFHQTLVFWGYRNGQSFCWMKRGQ